MKRIIIILFFLIILSNPIDSNATIVTEQESVITSEELNGNPNPPAPAPSNPPNIVTDTNTNNTTTIQPEKKKKPSSTSKKTNSENKEEKTEIEDTTEEEVVSENEVTTVVSENVVPQETVSENEVKEPDEKEEVKEEPKIDKDENEQEVQRKDFSGLKKTVGVLLLIVGAGLLVFFLYGHVKIYCLTQDNNYRYIGQCRISISKGDIRIYISKFILDRGATSQFKIELSDFLLNSKGKVILMLPEAAETEIGRARKEIQFNYN